MSPFPFLELIEILKTTRRAGWVRRNIPAPTESVADHMHRMAIMCRMADGFDEETRQRAETMALIHDVGEAITGDITPFDGISPDQKKLRDNLATNFLACTIRSSNPHFADLILELWNEYQDGKTQAAQLVKQSDKLECMDPAVLYEERSGIDLGDFMDLQKHVTLPQLRPWLEKRLQDYGELKARRSEDITIVFVVGVQASAKGHSAPASLTAAEFGFYHISVGDLLRKDSASPDSVYRDFINESIKNSVLIPAQLTTLLLKEELRAARAKGFSRFLLDGFPRSVDQAINFELKISTRYTTIYFECTSDAMSERLRVRAETSTRIDDTPETVVKRLRTFEENNQPLLTHLETRGPLHKQTARAKSRKSMPQYNP